MYVGADMDMKAAFCFRRSIFPWHNVWFVFLRAERATVLCGLLVHVGGDDSGWSGCWEVENQAHVVNDVRSKTLLRRRLLTSTVCCRLPLSVTL